jgi:hypothetical protein
VKSPHLTDRKIINLWLSLGFVLLLFPAIASYAAPYRVLDSADLASPMARAAHAVQYWQANPRSERATFGTLQLPVAGIALDPGGKVRVRLKGYSPYTAGKESGRRSVHITLSTAPEDFGKRQSYRVQVDGREVFRAVETDPGGGTCRSLFVDAGEARPFIWVEVQADEDTQARITVASLRCYANFDPPDPQAAKMALALLSTKGSGYTLDAGEMRDLLRRIPRSPYLVPQAAVLYNFCRRSAAENAKEIARLAALAETTGIPLRIAFQMHWGGAPKGVSDGAGGHFDDLPYQQITYDPEDNVDEPGLAALMGDRYDRRFGLSVPNVWGNTPWLTFNHPRLNQFRRLRLTQALYAWRLERQRLAAHGKAHLLPAELSTGEETVYWAKGVEDSRYTELNGGKPRRNLMADFNPFTVEDALRNRILLEPRDGLDNNERWWLHQNLARWQQKIIDWMFEALPAEPVQLGRRQPEFASDLVRRNLYTEPYAMPFFPMKDANPHRPGLELGYVRNGRSGGQYCSGATMLPWLLKERERGRIALPNLECTGADGPQLVACLRSAYACGARFAVLYNWQHRTEITNVLRQFAESIIKSAGVTFLPAARPNANTGRVMTREYVAPPEAFGINRIEFYRVDSGVETRHIRISLQTLTATGKDNHLTTRNQRARVWTLDARLPPHAPVAIVYLPTLFPQQPGEHYLLRVESLDGKLLPLATAVDGGMAARLSADIALERNRSQAIADWQDAEDIIASLQDLHTRAKQSRYARERLDAARKLLADNRPREAYAAAVQAEQLTLPAAFDVPAPGARLAPYWVTVMCPGGPVRAVITAYTDRTAVVTVRSGVAQTVTVRWGTVETIATLSPNVPAEITLDLGERKARPAPKVRPRRAATKRRTLRRSL